MLSTQSKAVLNMIPDPEPHRCLLCMCSGNVVIVGASDLATVVVADGVAAKVR